jgi:hypothetical protein
MHRAVVLGRPDILAILMSSKRWSLNQVPEPKVLKNEKKSQLLHNSSYSKYRMRSIVMDEITHQVTVRVSEYPC